MRLELPWLTTIIQGKAAELSLTALLGTCTSQFQGAPWRVLSVRGQVVVIDAAKVSGIGVAIAQCTLGTAATDNVEGVATWRKFTTNTPVSFRVNMPSPNPWKEDEQRGQAFATFEAIDDGLRRQVVIQWLCIVEIEFGPVPFGLSPSSALFSLTNCRPTSNC